MRFWSFKIFPDTKRNWYYKAHLFHTKPSMVKFRKSLDKDGANPMRMHEYAALCSAYNSTRKGEERQYGVLLFTQASGRKSGIVSHEIVHAVNYWWRSMERMRWENIQDTHKDGGRADERYAWLLGNCVAQYWREWYQMQKLMK